MFSINIKNGAKMKKFKKGYKSANKDKEDISCLYYWGSKTQLFASSWDGKVMLFDDNESTEEGTQKSKLEKHKEAVNYIDFKEEYSLCASCGDDGMIYMFNY